MKNWGVKSGAIAIALACLIVVKTGSVRADDYGTPIAVSAASPLTHADVTIGATSKSLICPANANHRYGVNVQNTGANPIRCGDNNVGVSQGQVLAADPNSNGAGSVASFPTTAAVYCYSQLGSTVACTELPR